MKSIGIIGGLGPETTSKFYLELIQQSFLQNELQRPAVLMWSISMDYEIERDFIFGKDQSSTYIKYLVEAAQRLEAGGADFIVIPCNSVHLFIDQVSAAVSIPVLSIVEETRKFLVNKDIHNVALLATKASVDGKLYQNELEAHEINVMLPKKEDQEKMGVLINKLVRNKYSAIQKQQLMEIIAHLTKNDLDAVLLACTDLQLLAPKHDLVMIIDTMKILVNSTVKMALDSDSI